MAPNRSSLLEDPPAVSSSEEEVETEEEEESTTGGSGNDDSDSDISDEELPIGEESKSSLFSCLIGSVQANNNLPILGASLLKEGLGLIGESKAKELEQKWRKLHIAEIEVFLMRLDLLRDQAMAVLKAINSSDD